jgi:hypothetical protein
LKLNNQNALIDLTKNKAMKLGFDFGASYVDPNHIFVIGTGKPRVGLVTYAALLMANQYLNQNYSVKQWRKINYIWTIRYDAGPRKGQHSMPLNYLILSDSIRELRGFYPDKLNLSEIHCDWMDGSMEVKLNFHLNDQTGTLGIASGDLQVYYGEKYPINPLLQREGRLYTSFQSQLIRRIIKERAGLIENGSGALEDDWIFDLRNLISNVISLVEISFTQLYIKAEYDPLPGWTFSKEKLGERHGRRMRDKFKWVYQITGKQSNIEAEYPSFESLRELRNHMMHFDPPSLVITLEEAVVWLNQIIDVAAMLIKIRRAIGVNVSADLINLLLQPEAVFVPGNKRKRNVVASSGLADYRSSTWPVRQM